MAKNLMCVCLFLFANIFSVSCFAGSEQRQLILVTATKEIGTKEEYTNGGKRVNEYLKTVGLPGGYYWCAAFVKWVYNKAKIKTPSACNGAARSWFERGKNIPIENALPGDLAAFYYRNLGRIGHIAIIENTSGAYFTTIEGNTSDGLSRNGDGVHRLRRLKRSIYRTANFVD